MTHDCVIDASVAIKLFLVESFSDLLESCAVNIAGHPIIVRCVQKYNFTAKNCTFCPKSTIHESCAVSMPAVIVISRMSEATKVFL